MQIRNEPPDLPKGTDIVGVRPDALLTAPPGQQPGGDDHGTVELIEPLGGEFHVHLRPAGGQQPFVAKLTGIDGLGEGRQTSFHVAHAQVHPFSSQTGRRTDQG